MTKQGGEISMEKGILDKLILKSAMTAENYEFEQEVPKRPNPLKLSKWLSKEIEEVERQIDLIEEEFKVKCTCGKGCSACCRQLIALSMSECLAIKPYIENLCKDEREELKTKVLEQCNILEKHSLTNKEINATQDEKVLQDKYFKLDMPCVFLDKENSCSIYKVRPSLCWSYRNYGDKLKCEKDYDVDSAIKYNDWEQKVFKRILTARPPRNGLYVLPFAIKEMMEWKVK